MRTSVRLTWHELREYTDDGVLRVVPKDPGVNRLGYYDSDDKRKVFYVGQGGDLEDRLRDHLRTSEPNACIKRHVETRRCYVKWAVIANSTTRDGAERALYDKFQPPCNELRPTGPDIDINFD